MYRTDDIKKTGFLDSETGDSAGRTRENAIVRQIALLPAICVVGIVLVITIFQLIPAGEVHAAGPDVPTLDFSTRFGGGSGLGIAVDEMGATYITGPTTSPFFENGNLYGEYMANDNAFVVKFSAAGTVEWTTLIGGSGNDHGLELAIDSEIVWLVGWTDSPDFYIDPGSSRGSGDLFLARLDRSNGQILSSLVTNFGAGAGQPQQVDLAIDGFGYLYIAGNTLGLETDIFVAKYSPDGVLIEPYPLITGGSGDDKAYGIAVDDYGVAYVTGGTSSSQFPGLQGTLTGSTDAFVLIVDATGSNAGGTYLGGNEASGVQGNEWGADIAIDQAARIYVTGRTSAPDFPVANAFDSSYNGGSDAFLTVLESSGSLVYSTFLGGSSNGSGRAVAVDSSGNAYISGRTMSGFPTKNAYDDSFNGKQDLFLAKIDPNGSGPESLVSSTYFGGKGTDGDGGMALTEGPDGVTILLTGWTHSRDFETTDGSDGGIFLVKLVFAPQGAPATSVHVGDIILTTATAGQGRKHGRAYVTIVDDQGNPVSDASLTGTFSGDFNESVTVATDSSGLAVLDTIEAKKGSLRFGFCVDDVSAAIQYEPGENTETCVSF